MVVHRKNLHRSRSPVARALMEKQNRPRVIPDKRIDKYAKEIGKIMRQGHEE